MDTCFKSQVCIFICLKIIYILKVQKGHQQEFWVQDKISLQNKNSSIKKLDAKSVIKLVCHAKTSRRPCGENEKCIHIQELDRLVEN